MTTFGRWVLSCATRGNAKQAPKEKKDRRWEGFIVFVIRMRMRGLFLSESGQELFISQTAYKNRKI